MSIAHVAKVLQVVASTSMLCLASGCGPQDREHGSAAKLIDTAVLADVSASQKSIAYYLNGASEYVKTPDRVITLGDGIPRSSFGERSENLLFTNGAIPSVDDPTQQFGAINFWTPAMSAPVKLSSGLAINSSSPPARSFVILFDAPNPTTSLQSGDVLLVRASDCAGNACSPVTLASNVQVTAVGYSLDGRFAGYIVVNGTGATALHETWLVDVAAGSTRKIAASMQSASFSFSPSGDLIATTTQSGTSNRQVQVFSTTTTMTVPWAQQPMTTETVAVDLIDDEQLLARVRPISITDSSFDSLYLMSVTTATRLTQAPGVYSVDRRNASTARWLFVAETSTRLLLYDLRDPSSLPAHLSTAFDAIPRMTQDGLAAAFIDDFDNSTGTGSLTLVELGTLSKTRVADNIAPRAYEFASGTNNLIWLDALDGTGMLREWKGGAAIDVAGPVFNFTSRSSPPTVFFTTISTTGPESLNVDPGSPGIWSIPTP